MKMIAGGGQRINDRLNRQRNGLLALVHIAKKELGLTDALYLAALERFGVASAGALSISELEELVKHFKGMGFRKAKGRRLKAEGKSPLPPFIKGGNRAGQVEVLQGKILERAFVLERGEQRMLGLVKAKCGVDDLRFCRDAGKLKQVLKILNLLG